jgi:hypothetical protein
MVVYLFHPFYVEQVNTLDAISSKWMAIGVHLKEG